ncbi:MAG: hypothetical protein ACREDK_06000 [Thermoplasmata archaeon]
MRRADVLAGMPYIDYDEVGAVCSFCGRQFPDEEALEGHRRDSHEIPDVTRRSATPSAPRRARAPQAARPSRLRDARRRA